MTPRVKEQLEKLRVLCDRGEDLAYMEKRGGYLDIFTALSTELDVTKKWLVEDDDWEGRQCK